MDSRNVYTAVGCNASCQNLDWNNQGLIVYGASYSCVVLEKTSGDLYRVKATYTKHTGKVNTVKWLATRKGSEAKFVSGGDDNVAYVWKVSDPCEPNILEGHTASINCVDSIDDSDTLLIVTASADGTVRLWKPELNQNVMFQTISLETRLCLSLSLAIIPSSDRIILAVSSTDNNIEIYIKNRKGDDKFAKQCELVGHENWVRCLDFVADENNELLLASSSQDGSIRLWRLSDRKATPVIEKSGKIDYNHLEECLGEFLENDNRDIVVNLESILQGHEDWVFGVNWFKMDKSLQLLSSSIDKSMILWQQKDNIWYETARLGVIGGNASGFFGGKVSADGRFIIGYGFLGSLYFWKKSNINTWQAIQCLEGHSAIVTDISWEKSGKLLISASKDKTTRVHASSVKGNWQVVSRPQIHGYGLECVSWIDSCTYVSGAEEKVIRVFQAPEEFNFNSIYQSPDSSCLFVGSKPFATVQDTLGLSNKIINQECDPCFAKEDGFKLDSKLWPETHKFYGHCNEIFAIACSPDLKYVASSAKAFNLEDAYILIWDASLWKIHQKLVAHSLTVTNLEFSKSSRFLLAVSKDRRWSLYTIDLNGEFLLVEVMDKSINVHNRVIWCCDWSHDDRFFATSSRDGNLAVWSLLSLDQRQEPRLVDCLEMRNESITACAFGYLLYNERSYIIAIGTEKGVIKLFNFDDNLRELFTVVTCDAHHLAVRRLKFRPSTTNIQLASCGDDCFVRVNEFFFS